MAHDNTLETIAPKLYAKHMAALEARATDVTEDPEERAQAHGRLANSAAIKAGATPEEANAADSAAIEAFRAGWVLTAAQIKAIRAVAEEDAVDLVNASEGPVDHSDGAGDQDAWIVSARDRALGDEATKEQAAAGFEVYSAHLQAETKRLAS